MKRKKEEEKKEKRKTLWIFFPTIFSTSKTSSSTSWEAKNLLKRKKIFNEILFNCVSFGNRRNYFLTA